MDQRVKDIYIIMVRAENVSEMIRLGRVNELKTIPLGRFFGYSFGQHKHGDIDICQGIVEQLKGVGKCSQV